MKEFTLEQLIDQHTDFTLAMFTEATPKSSLVKLVAELNELEQEISNNGSGLAEEYIDCIMCLLDSAARSGLRSSHLRRAFESKLAKNRARSWSKNADGTYSHIKHPTNNH